VDDYFAGSTPRVQPSVPAAPPYPPAAPQPSYPQAPYQQSGFQPAPVEPPQFARQGWAPPPGTVTAQQQGWGPNPYAQTKSNRPLVLGIVAAVGAVVLIMVLAAVQVVMKERNVYKHTTVTLPATLLGMPHLTDAVATRAESMADAFPGPGDGVVGVYGAGDQRVVVVAAKYHMGGSNQKDFLHEADGAAQDQGFTLAGTNAGRLGGTFRCGNHPTLPMTLCAFTDPGSYGVVMVSGGVDPTSTARSIREAVVQRS
jgi:hypothetical protein